MELIKITEKNGQKVVSARELHSWLEITERFNNWMDRQLQYGFIENIDYSGCKVFNTLAKQELGDYALSIDCAKEISMLQKSEKGKQARQYFIECEKQLLKPQTPQTYLEALKALVQSEEEKQILIEEKIKLQNTVNVLSHVNKTYTTTEIAKELNLKSAIQLNNLLSEKKVQFLSGNTWVLYAKYSNFGYVDIKQDILENGRIIYHRKWTQRGREFILNIASENIE